MATIKSCCTHCLKPVEFPHTALKVFREKTGHGAYRFKCPLCGLLVTRNAKAETVDVMIAAGAHWAPVVHFNPITETDTQRFHEAIHDEAVFAAALAGLCEPRRISPNHPSCQPMAVVPNRLLWNPLDVPVGAYVWDDLTGEFEQTAHEPHHSETSGRVTLAGRNWSMSFGPGEVAQVAESPAEAIQFNERRRNRQNGQGAA